MRYIYLFLFFTQFGISQNAEELELRLASTIDSNEYLSVANSLEAAYFRTDIIKCQELLTFNLELCDRLKNPFEKTRSHLINGDLLNKKNQSESSLAEYVMAKELAKKESFDSLCGIAYQKIGNYHLRLKDLEKADDQYKESISIRKKINDIEGLASVYNNMVVLKEQHGDEKSLLQFINESLTIRRKIGKPKELGLTITRLGNNHLKNNRFSEAEKCFNEVLTLIDEKTDARSYINGLKSLTTCNMELGDFKSAALNNDKALNAAIKLKDQNAINASNYKL